MLKIRALNREASTDEEVPVIRREAQEEIALELYNQALRLQATGDFVEAEKILHTLLNENIPTLETYGGLPSSMSTLKYSCYFNIGNVYLKNGDFDNALENYLNASELDSSDVTLWHRIGNLALQQDHFRQAGYAFSKGLECSESHWPCLDKLISILYATKDTIACLLYIGKALSLDPNYLKGLVLRKEIHRNNPGTLEYYKEYNPDYIWEPSLDVEIDSEEEVKVLEDEQKLCDRITQIEKSLGPKKLETIPLPKALDDFTWVSFGKVVVDLHKYIADNNMSHFTFVDLSKCMSQNQSSEPTSETTLTPEKKETELQTEPEPQPQNKTPPMTPVPKDDSTLQLPSSKQPQDDEKVEIIGQETVPERRPSQNSETNNDNNENTPNATDNDEDQAMEETDIEENLASNRKSSNNKRKRDLVSELQIWGWHSRRKSNKKGKPDRDLTVEDALNRIIPKNLLKNDVCAEKNNASEDLSMSTIDIYNLYVQNQSNINVLSPIHSPKSVNFEEYFGTDREIDDITRIWTKERKFCDAIVLIRDFVIELSKLWYIKWPNQLVELYIEAYNMFREHYDHPNAFGDETAFDEMRDEALATLLYGELYSFGAKDDGREIDGRSLAFLQVLSGWQEDWENEFVDFFVRVYWLRSHLFRKEGHYDLAINALTLIQEIIAEQSAISGEKYFLSLPNYMKSGLITNEIVEKILKHLDMITSLNCLEELYNAENYTEVAEILKSTFNHTGNHPTCGKMGRPAQLAMLLHSLWYTNLSDCFIWTEECLNEAVQHYLQPKNDFDKWEKIVEKCLAFFQEIIRMETVSVIDCLPEEKRTRLVEILTKIICKQLNSESTKIPLGCITPWILLHYILVREEHRLQALKVISHINLDKTVTESNETSEQQTVELPPSVAILFSAHEFLGPKGWCLTTTGELLHFMLDSILDRIDTPIFEPLRDKIDIHIEQALFCLYQHPSKKNKISRHLADHGVDPLPLTWTRAFQLFDFYGPSCLPEFNSYKNASITGDLEQLLQRIAALVPAEMDPAKHLPQLEDFIQGKGDRLPAALDHFSHKMRAIYYLIGDFYFKQREFKRCLKYFLMDLCINPGRFDTWACMGFSYLSQLENKLNYCKKLKNEMEFLDKAKCAQICFKKALEIEKDHIMLWIEFGSFEYMVHSFCSRVMKTESDTLSMERFEFLEAQKNYYLESSGQSFEKAIELYQPDESEADERWLQYYILGKVAEKQQKEPNDYLQYYLTASKLLHENDAIYPDKINYHNPQHLAVEALELHYRVNASILKYLELHEGKEILNSVGNLFKETLDKSFFPKKNLTKSKPLENSVRVNEAIANMNKVRDLEILNEVGNCLNHLLEKVVHDEKMVKSEKEESSHQVNDAGDCVIILSDSDDEVQGDDLSLKCTKVEVKSNNNGEELLDKLMTETIQKSVPMEVDTDQNNSSKNLVEIKEKEEMKASSGSIVNKLKSGSETETDVRTSVDETSSSPTSSSSSSSSSESDSEDDSSSSSTTSSSETITGNMSNSDILALIDRCIIGLEQCVIRLPQNYKALYRLAHIYHNYKAKKDLNKCKQLLLGEYKCKGDMTITGLFSDRKIQNFFNGIWRIPSSEIDRPGSLSAHMSRCITLLLQILRATDDTKLLLDLSIQFKKAPDPDKIYIKDSERLQFADQAMEMCIQSLRSQIQKVTPTMNESTRQKLLNDIFRSYQRIQKSEPTKESIFASMLTDVYKKIKADKIQIPENANVLDMATKFCQQNRVVEKVKKQPICTSTPINPAWAPGTQSPPVLPTPSALPFPTTPTTTPLKRSSIGRPRGRPPLSKPPNQKHVSRPSNEQFNWRSALPSFDPAFYYRSYQEELIKQYSQSLSLSQLSQLSSYYTQNQLVNTYAQAAQNQLVANQLLNQSGSLISNQSLLNKVATTSNRFLSQLGDIGKGISGSYTKKKTEESGKFGGLGAVSSHASKKSSSSAKNAGNSGIDVYKLPHSVANLTKPDSAFTKAQKASFYASNNVANDYFSKELSKRLKNLPQTQTSASLKEAKKSATKPAQFFKEPPTIKKKYASTNENAANILMKERPNISITPVMGSGTPMTSYTPSYTGVVQTSPGKTLQEKLADKQKQLSGKQQQLDAARLGLEAEIMKVGGGGGKKSGGGMPSLPSSLSVLKATLPSYKFPLESGISISQVPAVHSQPQVPKNIDSTRNKNINREKTQQPNKPPSKPSTSNTTSFVQSVSMNVVKKTTKKPSPASSQEDDVILID